MLCCTYHVTYHQTLRTWKCQRDREQILPIMRCYHLHHSFHVLINELHFPCQLIKLLEMKNKIKVMHISLCVHVFSVLVNPIYFVTFCHCAQCDSSS